MRSQGIFDATTFPPTGLLGSQRDSTLSDLRCGRGIQVRSEISHNLRSGGASKMCDGSGSA